MAGPTLESTRERTAVGEAYPLGGLRDGHSISRVAGIAFLVYIGAGLAESTMFSDALGNGRPVNQVASLSEHAATVRLSAVFAVVTTLAALVLAVALFGISRHYDGELALLALCARAAEAAIGGVSIVAGLAMVSVANDSSRPDGVTALVALTGLRDGAMIVSAICFAFGSSVFLRSRSIPVSLAWFGLMASILLLIALPLQIARGSQGAETWLAWIPMLIFELATAAWLILRGVRSPPSHGIA